MTTSRHNSWVNGMSGEDMQQAIEAAIEKRVGQRLDALTAQITEQNGQIRMLRQWTRMPGDYQLIPGDPRQRPRTIDLVVKDAIIDMLREIFSWKNITLALGILATFLTVLNQIADLLVGSVQ